MDEPDVKSSEVQFSSLTQEQIRLNDASDWDNWAATIDMKLNRTSTVALGALIGAVAGLALVGMQGTIVVRLMKTQAQIVGAVNAIVEGTLGTTEAPKERYSKPSGSINESNIAPVDEAEAAELAELMRKSKHGELPEFNEG